MGIFQSRTFWGAVGGALGFVGGHAIATFVTHAHQRAVANALVDAVKSGNEAKVTELVATVKKSLAA
jgi:hypothetical protein